MLKKSDLVKQIGAKLEISLKESNDALDKIVEVFADNIKNGESFALPGIGTFSTADVAEKSGIIQVGDKKGQKYTSPAHKKPVFKFSKSLKEALKETK